ncbi:peptide ABC transporter peptide-binding protein [Staphylococcus petrasii]|uniref:Nickel ABC transporter substrate-binding protein n=1 Tax=Staphylococcus petrasii TaxID=1276936 RepID=A0A380FWF3_9STAP|nr:ABC transporter substrate-binding protein [Staphylococcus petrasii]PNZ32149.1 nickel ABC transporter substrate-binding protein [Staphylococcus petrasii]TGE12139.1 nickel ABC transporter substrate-binding protein [Staphylococcus petrasii]TGE15893.1 nickel ABC transporter substrate-binding protein [Staphylococcus petrasii]SUM42617.1 peptide ABC transporter peptide-binding protein [Staphylococcus petrasii]
MKKRLIMTVAASATLLLAGCGNNHKDGKDITVSLPTEAKADKLDAQGYDAAMPVYSAVYDALVKYDKDKGIKAGLADKWSVDKSGKVYEFHLKDNVKFSDGSKLDAKAVKFSIERAKAMNKETTVETLKKLDKVVVKSDQVVQLKLKSPSNQVLNELTQVRPLRIMSPHSVEGEKVTGKFKKAIGTGAFVVDHTGKEKTTMKPNKYFDNNHPVKYNLAFQTIEDGDSRNSAVQSGSVDISGGSLGMLSDQQIKQDKKNNKLTVEDRPSTVSHFMAFNPNNKILSNKAIREAISKSVNAKAIAGKPVEGLFQNNVQYVNKENQQPHVFDIAGAEKLLKTEGYNKNKDGIFEKDGKPLSFNLVIQTAEFPNWKDKAEQVQRDMKQAGIKVNVKTLDAQSYYDTLWTKKDYDLIFYRTYSDALMPYNFMSSVFKNNDGKSGVLANDDALTKQLDDYPSYVSKEDQQRAFDDIFKHFNKQYYGVPIAYPNETFVVSDKVKEFKFSGLTDAPIDYKALKVKE